MFKKLAQNIAENTSEIIGRSVLVTDERGIIIGCSDKNRLGTFHEPSIEVIRENKPLVTGGEEAKGMKGVYPGYTLPIQLFDNVAGSGSLTGLPEEVERFGLLVKKQAEAMLRAQSFLESSYMRERALRDLVENVAAYDGSRSMAELISLQCRELGLTLSKCRCAVVAEMKRWENDSSENAYRLMLSEIRSLFSHPRNIICPQRNRLITVLVTPERELPEEESADNIEDTVRELVLNLSCKGVEADVALGFPASDLNGLAISLRSARDSLRLAGRLKRSGVISSRSLASEALLDLLPLGKREEFISRTLGVLESRSDYEDMRDTFLGWCESPFASGEVAERLSMHRNSLQYRLKKIRTLTGKDPWNFKDAFELWAAFVLKNIGSDGEKDPNLRI